MVSPLTIVRTPAGRSIHAQSTTRQPILPTATRKGSGNNAANQASGATQGAIKNPFARQPH